MDKVKKISTVLVFLILTAACSVAFAKDDLSARMFVFHASAEGVAEIELAKLALQKSTRGDIKYFAETIISNYTKLNSDIAGFARQKKLKISTDAELSDRAKAFVLRQREGDYFDDAFVDNQIKAHKKAIRLYRKASKSKDADLARFASSKLPILEMHLLQAEQIKNPFKE